MPVTFKTELLMVFIITNKMTSYYGHFCVLVLEKRALLRLPGDFGLTGHGPTLS